MRFFLGALCLLGIGAGFLGTLSLPSVWEAVKNQPAIVAMPQLILIVLVAGFGLLIAATAGGLCAILNHLHSERGSRKMLLSGPGAILSPNGFAPRATSELGPIPGEIRRDVQF